MIKPKKIKRARWASVQTAELRCPMCNGRGVRWRDGVGQYSRSPYPCTVCMGSGIPPIPACELNL